jgi:hypothetical protein
MASDDDLVRLRDDELVAAYVDNVRAREATARVGAHTRLMDRGMKIVAELKARSAGTLQPLRILRTSRRAIPPRSCSGRSTTRPSCARSAH